MNIKKRWLLTPACLLGLWLIFLLADRLDPLPDVQATRAQTVLAGDGTPLWRFADEQGVWRYQVSLDEVSPLYLEALINYEDRWFYRHPGVNPVAIVRALWLNQSEGRIVSGGSTLSMQVARIIEPHSRNWRGKLRQLWRTLQLEWHFSKRDILEIYLNRAPFGGTLEGVAAASWSYLGKPPLELTPSEAALLAVLPQAPSRLRPDRHPQRAEAARNKLLLRLQQYQVWPAQQIREAMEDGIALPSRQEPALAPLLARRLASGNRQHRIHTTLDANLQRRLEDLLLRWKNRLPPQGSAAILVVDSRTLQVRAYLGSADLNDAQRAGHVDMVQAIRSPGSTLKPFLYALAIEDGLIHSESLLQDVPRHHASYRPGNFSRGFGGPVSASDALTSSLNLPAVQLLEHYGPQRFDARLRQAGIRLRYPGNAEPNLSLILGGTGMSLESLVTAFAAFDRDGSTAPLRFEQGDSLQPRQLLDEGAGWIVQRILSGQRNPGLTAATRQGRHGSLAWKTGTSHGHRDAWAVGTGNGHVIGIWVGRPDGTPVPGQYGQVSAVPLLMQVHDMLGYSQAAVADKPQPARVGVAAICWPGGQPLPEQDSNCRRLRFAWTLDAMVPTTLNNAGISQRIWHNIWLDAEGRQVHADCPDARPQQLALWPAALEPWLPRREQRMQRLPALSPSCPPRTPLRSGQIQITGVTPGSRLQLPPGSALHQQGLALSFGAAGAGQQLWWYLNGQPLAHTTGQQPLQHSFHQPGPQQLSLMDELGQTARLEFEIRP